MNRSDKTDCEKVRENLNRFVDEDLKGAARTECAAHLDKCESCRTQHAQLLGLRAALRRLPVPDGGETVQTRVFQNLERAVRTQPAHKSPRFVWGARPLYAALSAAVVVGVGLVVVLPFAPKPSTTETASVPLPPASEMSVLFQMHDAQTIASAAAEGNAFPDAHGASGNGAF